MKTRGTATDKLADVIQALQLVRKTGLLTVQRDATEGMSEEGKIAFRDGQVVDAVAGQLRGADAFKKLVMWTRCHFVFEPVAPTPPSPIALPSPRAGNKGAEWRNTQESSGEYLSVNVVPYRSQYVRGALPDFQRLGLSRIHRQLFLLIDGKRSTQELSLLLRRHPQEALALLADLESAGLIHQ
jgi:hypothetical protein